MAKSTAKSTVAKSGQQVAKEGPTCRKKHGAFCFVCARYTKVSTRKPFTNTLKENYQKQFGIKNLKNSDYPFAGSCICGTCQKDLSNKTSRFRRPAVWHAPQEADHSDCFICETSKTKPVVILNKRRKVPFAYQGGLSVDLPSKEKTAEPLNDNDGEDSETEEMTIDELARQADEGEDATS